MLVVDETMTTHNSVGKSLKILTLTLTFIISVPNFKVAFQSSKLNEIEFNYMWGSPILMKLLEQPQ